MNRWGIPAWLEAEVITRDRRCVYCGIEFVTNDPRRGCKASWEHIVNDVTIVSAANITRCCVSCNASKGAKPLDRWLESNYCKRRGIGPVSVSEVVRRHLQSNATTSDGRAASQADQTGKRAASSSSGSRNALVR
jgi:hypothetical protein